MFKSIKMKRILSIILAAVMLVMLVPGEFLGGTSKVYAATGQEIVDDALSFAVPTDSYGRPTQAPKVNYVAGGLDLSVGVDCSGFVCAIFKRHGLDLVSMGIRSSYDMYDNASKFGTKVETDTESMIKEIRSGDILVTNNVGHVGIAWVNNGTVYMIHSGNTSTGVIYQTLSSYGYSKLVAVIHPNIVSGGTSTTPDTSEDTGEVGTEDTNPGHPYSIPSGEVKGGSNANRVKWVQRALNNTTGSSLQIDGSFGQTTIDAVKSFQKANGLKETGTANQETIDLLITYYRNYRDVTEIAFDVSDDDKVKTKSDEYKKQEAEKTTESTDSTDSSTEKKDDTEKKDETKTEIDPEAVCFKIGETYKIVTKLTPEKAIRKTLKYSSSNSDIIEVKDDGTVTAVASGTATVTVTAESGVTATLSFKIEGSIYQSEWRNGRWYDADGEQTYKYKGQWMVNYRGWWYQDSSGWYPHDQWQKINGEWYYFDSTGYMVSKSWRFVSGAWYYFHKDGSMASEEWIDGYWLSHDGAWSYAYTGTWKRDGYGWWYEDTSGWYPVNMTQKIDGVNYHFNSSGYWDY